MPSVAALVEGIMVLLNDTYTTREMAWNYGASRRRDTVLLFEQMFDPVTHECMSFLSPPLPLFFFPTLAVSEAECLVYFWIEWVSAVLAALLVNFI